MIPFSPLEILPHAQRVLEVVKDLPPEQQEAVLRAASDCAGAAVQLRARLYMQGSIIASLTRK